MATKTPAAKKAAKPATKQTPKKPTVKKDSPAVATAKAKVEPTKVKRDVNGEKLKNSSVSGTFGKPMGPSQKPAAAKVKTDVKLSQKKSAPVKKVSKVDKLMKTPPAAPMTETQKVLASLAGTALKQRLSDPAKKQPAPEVQEQAPTPAYERPAVAPQETMSFGERLRAARRNPPPARSAFAERMRRGNRGNY